MYLTLERKPNNGGKIQNLTDVASGIMLCLKIFKSTNKEKTISIADAANAITANNNITTANEGKKGTHGRLVTADKYFVSV